MGTAENSFAQKLVRHLIVPIIILLLSLFPLAIPYLQSGYQIAHDRHVPFMRVAALRDALAEGQIPPRWFVDFDGGYGSPYPSFYGMLFYHIAVVLNFLGLPVGSAVECTAFLTFVVAAIGMFLYAGRLFDVPSGILAAVLYSYAPYHLVDAFVRGAYSELASFIWFPWIFFALSKWTENGRKRWVFLGAWFIAGLITTHNLMPILFLPAAAVISLLEIKTSSFSLEERKRRYVGLVFSWILAVLISAFFWLPILLERGLIRMDYFLQYDYRRSFVNPLKLFFHWSAFGLTTEVGMVHILSAMTAVCFSFRSRCTKKTARYIVGFCCVSLLYFFMATRLSAILWTLLPFLSIVQFPWRFLAPGMFFLSFAAGAFPYYIPNRRLKWAAVILTSIAVILFHKSLIQIPNTADSVKTKRSAIRSEIWGTQDYRPHWAQMPFVSGPLSSVDTLYSDVLQPSDGKPPYKNNEGITVLHMQRSGSTWNVVCQNNDTASLVLPQFYFPGWKAWADAVPVSIKPSDTTGLQKIVLIPGEHSLRVSYTETPVRMFGNGLTLIGVLLSVLYLLIRKFNFNRLSKVSDI
ncbi:MAG: hypothetical protein JW913_18930 [Chitinispirillaceae bacterium]|nr:hypothetical protein [Chitinispirillaceae bacterium]